ncbi:enoyl-CoA hydratase/isomerase family protein [Sinorhizobium medicae]|nr:enoyl-CoA hydratase/isomerase family protein [Sinorhizobium medicae]MDX0444528.1 enoyl-CoA hydratase/isomerase family protein [Sinorhizobium medicae]MDX0489804.1 enoyl-CoA hydratase/isomerase family protein [Sinorhizobium medicae]MDX0523630.1 enoyl-CoA hydratase/isomerase family protein [Sinorhizobium medicae]MDX0539567.1 enoyl-CoA hydratase/isomerase family protein [Sinorhizobium medicae]
MSFDAVSVTQDGAVARVVLNRPQSRNAVNLEMCIALREAFQRLDSKPDVRVILLSASGPVFCAGADLKERTDKDEAWVLARRQASFAAYDAIGRCGKPIVALTQGPVVGSGGEIIMSCDFVVASQETTFRFPEPQWGTVGATQRLQRVIGRMNAKELLFTGRTMPVEEAYQRGLVSRVVPADELEKVGQEIAESIAAAPPLAMALSKQAVDLGYETNLSNGIRIEMAAIERCLADGDWRSGIEKFSEVFGSESGK